MNESLSVAAGQVLIAGFPGRTAPNSLLTRIGSGQLGGVILFKRNLGSVAEVVGLVEELTGAAPPDRPLLMSIDQEGGRVARLGEPVLRLPPMRALGIINDSNLTRRAGTILGQQLSALGFNCDFAPVLDVDTNPENPVIGDRAFGADPGTVVRHGMAFAEGLHSAGLLSCGKHFPGHGDTELDSHLALPILPHDRTRLEAVELVPFRAAKGRIPLLMTAHVVFEALDAGVPATLSRAVIEGLLRGELGYDGLVVSDDLEMKAVSERWGVPDAACRAIEAGCDALLVCSDLTLLEEAHSALVRAAERNPAFAHRLEHAAERCIATRRAVRSGPRSSPADVDRLLASYPARDLELAIRKRMAETSP